MCQSIHQTHQKCIYKVAVSGVYKEDMLGKTAKRTQIQHRNNIPVSLITIYLYQ